MKQFNVNNPNREKCESCGHEKLTNEEMDFLADDCKGSLGYLIRNKMHNQISQETAEMLVPLCIGFGLNMLEEAMRYGSVIRDMVITDAIQQQLLGKK